MKEPSPPLRRDKERVIGVPEFTPEFVGGTGCTPRYAFSLTVLRKGEEEAWKVVCVSGMNPFFQKSRVSRRSWFMYSREISGRVGERDWIRGGGFGGPVMTDVSSCCSLKPPRKERVESAAAC